MRLLVLALALSLAGPDARRASWLRPAACVLALALAAGCTAPAAEEDAPNSEVTPTAATPPRTVAPPPRAASPTAAPASAPAPAEDVAPLDATPTGPPEPRTLRFALAADRSIVPLAEGVTVPTEERVPEPVSGADFAIGLPQGLAFEPFVSAPMSEAFEIVDEFTLQMRFVASAPAVAALPAEANAPTIGVWFGTPDRAIAFLTADVPTVLEPDEVVTVDLVVPASAGGILVRAGETFVIRSYLSYQTADGSKIDWLVGGDEPAGFTLTVIPVELGSPIASVLLDETTGVLPSPAFTSNDPQPQTFEIEVPAGTVWLIAELVGTPRAGSTMDMDLTLVDGEGQLVAGSYGPYAHEIVVLGPGGLAAAGSTLTARTASGTSPTGGELHLVVTAYVAAGEQPSSEPSSAR